MRAAQVIYSGRVQGVGFRYSVKRIAGGYDVAGWVKNLPDGSVELFAQALDPEELSAFLTAILDSDLRAHIREHPCTPQPPQTGLVGFSIHR